MIGGNVSFEIQRMTATQNEIGEDVASWETVYQGIGWLDMSSGDSTVTYQTKITESTHMLMSDYFNFKAREIKAEGHRAIVDGDVYELKYIDDPMSLHQHLEIYLKYTGGV